MSRSSGSWCKSKKLPYLRVEIRLSIRLITLRKQNNLYAANLTTKLMLVWSSKLKRGEKGQSFLIAYEICPIWTKFGSSQQRWKTKERKKSKLKQLWWVSTKNLISSCKFYIHVACWAAQHTATVANNSYRFRADLVIDGHV